MVDNEIAGVIITPLKIIDVDSGNVLHAMKKTDPGFSGFGEAYFSTIKPKAIKAWKQHLEMILNLIVPSGAIRFVLYDDRPGSISRKQFQEVTISESNYCRLTVPAMVWAGFQGVGDNDSMLLNIADILHEPSEINRKNIDEIKYIWDEN